MTPLKHIAPLVVRSDAGKWDLAGTAFCLRSAEYMITAAHCLRDLPAARIGYFDMARNRVIPCAAVDAHPAADIAIMRVPDASGLTGFWLFFSGGLGEEFLTYGFPYEDLVGGIKQLLPRLFHGHIQRAGFDYAHGPWKYPAAELSLPAPLGLSGAPLFRPGAPQVVIGMVTANVSSELVEDYYEETDRDGQKVVHKTARITTYGIALTPSDPITAWLNERLPPDEPGSKRPWE